MSKNFYVDHHIQSSILDVLIHEGSKSFSALKPDDLENSLFMYHMRKLMSRGIVEKQNGNFVVTPEGMRWINKTGVELTLPESPRCLVQLLIIKNDKVLISERLEHMAKHMNRFTLPGGLHKFGKTSRDCAELVATNIGVDSVGTLVTQVETIIPAHDHHSIADIYLAEVEKEEFSFTDDLYKINFVDVDSVKNMSTDEAGILPDLLKKHLNNSLKDREVFNL